MYELTRKKEIGFEIIVEDKFPNNDIETDESKWNVKLVFYGNDKEHTCLRWRMQYPKRVVR